MMPDTYDVGRLDPLDLFPDCLPPSTLPSPLPLSLSAIFLSLSAFTSSQSSNLGKERTDFSPGFWLRLGYPPLLPARSAMTSSKSFQSDSAWQLRPTKKVNRLPLAPNHPQVGAIPAHRNAGCSAYG